MPQMERDEAMQVDSCEPVYNIRVMAKDAMLLRAGIYATDENCIGIHAMQ